MTSPDSAPVRDRSVPGIVVQSLFLLLGVLGISAIGGVLLAAFFLPAVTLSSTVARDSVDFFDSLPSELEVAEPNEASTIKAADGSVLAVFYDQNRKVVALDDIDEDLQHAVISIEDRRFYEHGGIDLQGTIRAFASNSLGDSGTQGGSSLTQQYVKNALLMDAQQQDDDEAMAAATAPTYERKLKEMKLSISVEKKYSKDEILGAYLNIAQFGPSQYGVETAAQHYFNKSAKKLTPGEAALLAGITNSPNGNDPVNHPAAAEKRRDQVLWDMKRDGYIDQEQFDKYTDQSIEDMLDVQDVEAGCESAGTKGFFCDYVVRSLLNDPAFGDTAQERRNKLYGGGLTITTTLDPDKQKVAQDILERRVPADSDSGFGHAITTVEPGTGKILVMAQNRTFNPGEDVGPGETAINYMVPNAMGGGNGFPVGSTFKPFVLMEWLQSGHSLYDTVPTARSEMHSFPAQCLSGGRWYENPGYDPDNAVSVALAPQETALNATKFSVNTAYANMAQRLDLCNIADGARDIGVIPAKYSPLDPKSYEMSIDEMYGTDLAPAAVVLGELNISGLDMAAAYATFAAEGTYCKPTAITEVKDRNGKKVDITGSECTQAIKKEVADTLAWTLEQDLVDPQATGKGKVIPGHDAGGKTGTSGSQFHTWYVGFTRQMSTAVWLGNPSANVKPGGFSVDGQYLYTGKVWGNTVSLPTWQEYMTKVHEGLPNKAFPSGPAQPASTPTDQNAATGQTDQSGTAQEGPADDSEQQEQQPGREEDTGDN
jgi:membrane peptidoglycan carboxypeptidase